MTLRLLPRENLGQRLDELQRVANELFGNGVRFEASTERPYSRSDEPTPPDKTIEIKVSVELAEPFPRLESNRLRPGGAASAGEGHGEPSPAPHRESARAAPSFSGVIPTVPTEGGGALSRSPWNADQLRAARLVLQAGAVVDLDAACAVMAQFAEAFRSPPPVPGRKGPHNSDGSANIAKEFSGQETCPGCGRVPFVLGERHDLVYCFRCGVESIECPDLGGHPMSGVTIWNNFVRAVEERHATAKQNTAQRERLDVGEKTEPCDTLGAATPTASVGQRDSEPSNASTTGGRIAPGRTTSEVRAESPVVLGPVVHGAPHSAGVGHSQAETSAHDARMDERLLCKQEQGSSILSVGSNTSRGTDPRTPPAVAAARTCWTEEQRNAANSVREAVREGWGHERVCAEIARVAHLFVQAPASARETRYTAHDDEHKTERRIITPLTIDDSDGQPFDVDDDQGRIVPSAAATETPDDDEERCEGCGAPASGHDADDVPLCKPCLDALVEDTDSPASVAKSRARYGTKPAPKCTPIEPVPSPSAPAEPRPS